MKVDTRWKVLTAILSLDVRGGDIMAQASACGPPKRRRFVDFPHFFGLKETSHWGRCKF
jgi:hypothetical protein